METRVFPRTGMSASSLLLAVAHGALFVLAASLSLTAADNPSPNSDPIYQQIRNVTLGGEAVTVNNIKLRRDAATFQFRSGTICFVTPVNGKITGAVFTGDGNLVVNTSDATERASLRLLTKEDGFSEDFSQAVFLFTDSTYDEIKKGGAIAGGTCDAGLLKDIQNTTRHKLKRNLEARILADVLSPAPGAYFVAFIRGKRYGSKEIFEIDPNHRTGQVNFSTYEDNKSGHWLSLDLSDKTIPVGHPTRILHQQLDATFEKNGSLEGKATAEVVVQRNGLRVVALDLFPSLRVQSVNVDGQPASFIQQDKNDDADFSVVLPRAFSAGDKFTITTTYAGKDAVLNTGDGNYYPVARGDWYPNQPYDSEDCYTQYDMTLRIPKGMKMAATGMLVSESNQERHNITVWKSEAPQTDAGFSFGRFREEQKKLDRPGYLIQSYANEEPPDWVKGLQHRDLDNLANGPPSSGDVMRPNQEGTAPHNEMSTASLNKKALAEAQLAVQLYSDYFGPPLFKHLQLTQQTACNYGQSWPELVWLPLCYYFDTTVRHSLGLDDTNKGYWKVVTAHEVAHQWWGTRSASLPAATSG